MNQPANLQEIVALSRRQIMLEGLVEEQEAALKDLKALLAGVQLEDLPLAMSEAGLKKFTLDTGETIDVKDDLVLSLSAERKPEAFAWLEKNGLGSVIKTVVVAEFGKGQLGEAQKLAAKLVKEKYNVHLGRDVHWQTLKALILERVRAAKPIPLELFGAHPINKANVEPPKEK